MAKASATPSSTPKSTSPAPSPTPSATKSPSEFDVPELGIKITLPVGLAGLTYTASLDQQGTDGNGSYKYSATRFSTKALAAADSQCASDALGAFNLLSFDPIGKLMDVSADNTKQIGQDYLVYAGPQAACSTTAAVNNMQSSLIPLMKQAFESASPLQ